MPLTHAANICPGCSEILSGPRCPCGYIDPIVKSQQEAEREARIAALKTAGVRPQIDIDLYSSHGNAFVIMASVTKAMKEFGADREQIAQVMEQAKSHDYEYLVRHLDKFVKLNPVGFESLDEFFMDYNGIDRRSEEYRVRDEVPVELQEDYKRRVMETIQTLNERSTK